MTDISPETVAKMLVRLRGTPLYEGHGEGSDAPDEAADMLEAIAARLAEVTAERVVPADARIERLQSENESLRQQVLNMQEHFTTQKTRAEAAEAKLAASEARVEKLREKLNILAHNFEYGHLWAGETRADVIRGVEKIARAALQEATQ